MDDYLLSIIIPAYNEEDSISFVLNQVLEYCAEINKEIIVIDDGSDDTTFDIIQNYDDVIPIRHEQNMGKGKALQTGFNHAQGNLIIVQDADMEYHPQDIPALIKPILNDEADVVYGSRFKGKGIETMSFSHRFGNWGLTLATRLLYGFKTTDMETGYKVFKKELIADVELTANSFNIEPELTAIFSKRNARFVEVPISYKYREKGEAKISWRDGVVALWWLIKLKFRRY